MSLEYGPAHTEDYDEIAALYDALLDHLARNVNGPGWKKGVYPALEDARSDLAAGTLHLARRKGRIAGITTLGPQPIAAGLKVAWPVQAAPEQVLSIHRFMVHPAFQRQGVGAGLLAYADRMAAERGARALRLDVYQGNAAARALYERAGYRLVDTVDLGFAQYGLALFCLYEKPVADGRAGG